MKLWGYYALHTFVNTIKKMFRSTFLVIFLAIIGFGVIFGLVGGIAGSVMDHQQAAEQASEMQESEDEEETINMVLAELGQRLRGDRTYIFEICGKKMSNTYEWCAPGIPSELRELQSIPTVICHHWIAGFLQAKPYVLKDLETHKDTEPEEYNRLKRQGIHALIAVPLFEQGVLSGFLGIDNPPLENGGNITEILQLIAYFIQSALTRKKATEKLRKMTYTDEMTGVKNRNAFIHKIEQLPHLALFNSAEDSKEPGDIGQFTVFHHFGKGHLDPPLGVLEVCVLRNFLECVRIA